MSKLQLIVAQASCLRSLFANKMPFAAHVPALRELRSILLLVLLTLHLFSRQAQAQTPQLGDEQMDGVTPVQAEEQNGLPASDANPFNPPGDSLDNLIQRGINADLWQQMQGELPCLEATTECIAQLQALTVEQNPLLQEVDARIEEISTKIAEAKAANKKSIKLSILRPAARVFLEPTFNTPIPNGKRQPGPIEKMTQLFTKPVEVLNDLLKAIGIPFLDGIFGGNEQNQERAIAISDLAVQLAQIQRSRAELANQVKEKVALSVFDFDVSKREFQIALEIAKRETQRMELASIDYRLGGSDSVTYLSQLSSLDRNKAATWRSWFSMRSQLEKIKLLVLGTPE